jgi:hypothetical protein
MPGDLVRWPPTAGKPPSRPGPEAQQVPGDPLAASYHVGTPLAPGPRSTSPQGVRNEDLQQAGQVAAGASGDEFPMTADTTARHDRREPEHCAYENSGHSGRVGSKCRRSLVARARSSRSGSGPGASPARSAIVTSQAAGSRSFLPGHDCDRDLRADSVPPDVALSNLARLPDRRSPALDCRLKLCPRSLLPRHHRCR